MQVNSKLASKGCSRRGFKHKLKSRLQVTHSTRGCMVGGGKQGSPVAGLGVAVVKMSH